MVTASGEQCKTFGFYCTNNQLGDKVKGKTPVKRCSCENTGPIGSHDARGDTSKPVLLVVWTGVEEDVVQFRGG